MNWITPQMRYFKLVRFDDEEPRNDAEYMNKQCEWTQQNGKPREFWKKRSNKYRVQRCMITLYYLFSYKSFKKHHNNNQSDEKKPKQTKAKQSNKANPAQHEEQKQTQYHIIWYKLELDKTRRKTTSKEKGGGKGRGEKIIPTKTKERSLW